MARMWTHLKPMHNGDSETDSGEKVTGGLVVASCDAAPVRQSAEGSLDQVARAVDSRVECSRS